MLLLLAILTSKNYGSIFIKFPLFNWVFILYQDKVEYYIDKVNMEKKKKEQKMNFLLMGSEQYSLNFLTH